MLTYDDEPLIRNAILKRLDAESGVKIYDIQVHPRRKFMVVKVGAIVSPTVGNGCNVQSRFDLPASFEHAHLLDEIDQIAEQYKAAKKDWWLEGCPPNMEPRTLLGTGSRGLWERYG